MSLVAKTKGEGDFAPAPAGTHIARCFNVIDIGTQASPMFPASHKVQLSFELPNETFEVVVENGKTERKPFVVSKDYTLSLSPKSNLRQDLINWRGRDFTEDELAGFDVGAVLGAVAQITITHRRSRDGSRVYAAITSVTKPMKGNSCPPAVNPLVKYDIDEGESHSYKSLPEWIQRKICQAEEWRRRTRVQPPPGTTEALPDHGGVAPNDDDDIPF